MDNLAHGLFGAALGETGLKRWTPLAIPTLVLGANLPDVDVVAVWGGTDFTFWARRGLTHGVLAMLLWPPLLAAAMWGWDVWRRRPERARGTAGPPARFGPLLALAALAVWSHPLLDWLNNYGVRWLMPFDGRWFYGDALFIIDPWMWLLAASPVVWVHSKRGRSLWLWGLLAVGTSALVLFTPQVSLPLGVKAAWCGGVALMAGVRWRLGPRSEVPHWARAVVLGLGAYATAMKLGTQWAEGQAERWLRAQGLPFERIQAEPVAGNPLARDVIVAAPGGYRFLWVDALARPTVAEGAPAIPREAGSPLIEAALSQPEVRGRANWYRFPVFRIEEVAGGAWVHVDDVRYARAGRGLGSASIFVAAPRP